MTGVQGMRITAAAGWTDRSMIVLTADEPGTGAVSPSLVVTREPLRAGGPGADGVAARLEAHVDAQEAGWRGMPGYQPVMRRRATPAEPVAEVRIVWTDGDVPLAQWLTFAPTDGDRVIVAAATAARADMAELEPRFRGLLETLRVE